MVLAPRRRRQASRDYSWEAMETNQPDLQGEHEVSRKTIARGMPGCSGVLVVTTLACFVFYCMRGCGRIARPAFPAPSVSEEPDQNANPRAKNMRRDRGVVHGDLPSLHARLRVVGSRRAKLALRGRGWGAARHTLKQRFLRRDPPPPTPPRRFAGGGGQALLNDSLNPPTPPRTPPPCAISRSRRRSACRIRPT